MKKLTKRAVSTALTVPVPLPAFVRDDELIQGRPDVIADGMMGRVQELVTLTAYMSADVARGTMTGAKLMQVSASFNQLSMILARQGLGLLAEQKRQEAIREEERMIVLVANKSGSALKLLRIILSQFGSGWAFHRMNDETGVMARVPMGQLIGELLSQQEVVPVNQGDERVTRADGLSADFDNSRAENRRAPISDAEQQARTTVSRVAAAGGHFRTQEQVAADDKEARTEPTPDA